MGCSDPTTAYANGVVSGRIVAGPWVRAACQRHLNDLQHGHERGLRFDLERADHALGFFPAVLRLAGGQFEGNPFCLSGWQEFVVGSLFGWLRDDGTRRFRVAMIQASKGCGKSPLAAGIGLYGLVADDEPRAEIYAAASKKDQAMVLYRDAVAMVSQSPALSKRLRKYGSGDQVWNLFDEKTNSFFRPISADDGQSGPRPHIGLVDELHEHKTPNVLGMLAAGRKWRRQPLILAITNAGIDRKSVCWEYREKGIKVASGVDQDDTFFSFICELDEGEDPFIDESCWPKANPSLGELITYQYLRDEVNGARGMPSKEALVRRLNFCEWLEGHAPFVPYDKWMAARALYGLDRFRGRSAVGAFDLSATTDLTALVLLFVIDGISWLWPVFWIPKEGLSERAKKDGVPYGAWVRDGHVFTTPGAAIDKDHVVAQVAKLLGQHDITITKAPFDRWRIDTLQAACSRQGVKWPLEPFGQGFTSMAPAVDAFEVALVSGTLRHPGNPVLDWNSANAVTESDAAGNRKLTKAKATGRIDGLVAALMAIGAGVAPEKPKPKFQAFTIGR